MFRLFIHNSLGNDFELCKTGNKAFRLRHSQFTVPVPFSFTLTSKSENCYAGTEYSGKIELEKSFINTTDRQAEGFVELYSLCSQHESLLTVETVVRNLVDQRYLLVSEAVSTMEYFFTRERKNLGSDVTKEQWWGLIAEMFKIIFRDIIQGLLYLYLSTTHVCANLSFNAYVTRHGRGRILPSLGRTITGAADDIKQLKALMHTVIFFSFTDKTDDLMLPVELRRFLGLDHLKCCFLRSMSSPWFFIDTPFFWSVEERIHFAHNLKKLLKFEENIWHAVESWLDEKSCLKIGMSFLKACFKRCCSILTGKN